MHLPDRRETYLDHLVPSSANNHWILRVRAEPHTRDPLSVPLLRDRVFAITQSVPQLDSSVPRARDNLTVVGGEGNRENIIGMSNKSTSGNTG